MMNLPGTTAGSTQDLDVQIAAHSAELPGLLDRLESYAETVQLPPLTSHRLCMICEELATNVVTHGTAQPPEATFVAFSLRKLPQELHVRVEDDGPSFDPLSLAAPDTEAALEDRDIGGLGIHLVKTMAREVRYQRVDSHNRLDLVLATEH